MTVAAIAFDAVPVVALIVGIVAAIAALVVGIVELVKHWTTVWHAIESVVSDVAGVIKRLFTGVLSFLEGIFAAIPGVAVTAWHLIESTASSVVHSVLDFFAEIPAALESVFMAVLHAAEDAWKELATLTSTVVDAVVGFFEAVPGKILGFLSQIVSSFTSAWAKVLSGAAGLVSSVVSFFAGLPGKILGFVAQVVGHFVTGFANILAGAVKLVGNIVTWFAGLPGKALSAIASLPGDFAGIFTTIVSNAVSTLTGIVTFVASLPGKVASAASGLWSGLKSGLVDAVNWIIGKLNDVINAYNSVVGSIPIFGGSLKIGDIGKIAQPATPTTGAPAGNPGHLVHQLGIGGGETYAQQQYNIAHDTGAPSTRVARAHDDVASAAGRLTAALNMTTDAAKAHAASTGLPGFSASQSAVARQLMAIFTSGGLSKAGAAALVGNAAQESSLNPSEPGGLLFQWQGSRLAAEQAFAAAHHEASTSVAAEGGFALQELKGYPQLLSDLQAATNPRSAAAEVSNVYERPNVGLANLPNREQQAAAALAAFGGASAHGASAPAGTYLDPFYRASGVVRGRTDQGVDYGFSGPLGAVGPGLIEAIKQFQGFGTTIEERLTSGPEKGKLIYTALENGATLLAHAGEKVAAGTAIAQGLGRGGIEMGFAQGSGPQYGLPVTRYGPGQSHDIPTSGGIAFSNFLAEVKTGAALGQGPAAGAASLAMTVAQEKAALNVEIAREKAAVAGEVLKLRDSVKGKGVSPEEKTKVAGEIAALRSALSVEVAQQRGALSVQTAAQKAELAKQTTDLKAGTSTLGKLLSAIHSGSLKTLSGLLDSTHNQALRKLEASLDHDHSVALAGLAAQLVKVHQEALAKLAAETAAAAAAAAAKAAAAAAAAAAAELNRESTDITRTATDQATQIADATKVYLDQQAAVGLTGAALVAANDQTALDQTVQASDAAIATAQAAVDAAASGTALAQAQAANELAQAQAAATVAQAQAQSTLDIANAAAAKASSTTTTTTTTNAPTFNVQFFGTAGMSEAQLMKELGFAVATGALPLAPVTSGH